MTRLDLIGSSVASKCRFTPTPISIQHSHGHDQTIGDGGTRMGEDSVCCMDFDCAAGGDDGRRG
jgi:hypothetical protein